MISFLITLAICIVLGIVLRNHRIKRDTKKGTMLGGVCAGIAKSLKIEPLWIRLAFVISVIFFGFGIMLYLILRILLPSE